MNKLKLEFKVEREQQLKEFLAEKQISKKTLTKIKFEDSGSIKVNGIEQNVRYILSKGDIVEISLPDEEYSPNVRFIEGRLNIVYEDKYILILNKEPGIPSIPSRNQEDESILEFVNFYFKSKNYLTIPHIVTRLDKNTSGLLLIAKHRHIHSLLSKIEIEKYYLALVKGKTPKETMIVANIKRENDSIIKRCVDLAGEYAKTYMERIKYYSSDNVSLIKLRLYTGRTHQIRVHMKYIGFPLMGDDLYGGSVNLITRQALHCSNLILIHPLTKEKIDIKVELPNDIKRILEKNNKFSEN